MFYIINYTVLVQSIIWESFKCTYILNVFIVAVSVLFCFHYSLNNGVCDNADDDDDDDGWRSTIKITFRVNCSIFACNCTRGELHTMAWLDGLDAELGGDDGCN